MSIITEGRWTPDVVTALCQQLYALARREEEAAASLAARTPYWAPSPPSVEAHRTAARLLRADADRLEFESRPWGVPI
ncbi:hypothetical protein AB0E63_20445 [Kribbella sp. NPDC026596]|uniref:hypothetical protein n=1 Tax=Kribbella sp. NPDC026596 TaxID=3155122 RepID=UPI0033DC24E8